MDKPQQPHVVLVATGGTISSRAQAGSGDAVAADRGAEILGTLRLRPAAPVRVVDVLGVGSYLLTITDMLTVCQTIRTVLADPGVLGVVVTHGTDTMEETAYLADLTHDDDRPVVFTGAQRSADSPDPDGPDNLFRAIMLAGSPEARGRGVLLAFAGAVLPAKGVRKSETLALGAFANPAAGVVGTVTEAGEVEFTLPRRRSAALPLPMASGDAPPRVDLVAVYPGADGIQLRACAEAGARGIVLQATGSGNGNREICDTVTRLTEQGVHVITSTRVDAGPVVPIYGDGGGRSLIAAGAIPSGLLRPSQSLVLLSLLLRLGLSRDALADVFAREGSDGPLDPAAAPPSGPAAPGLRSTATSSIPSRSFPSP